MSQFKSVAPFEGTTVHMPADIAYSKQQNPPTRNEVVGTAIVIVNMFWIGALIGCIVVVAVSTLAQCVPNYLYIYKPLMEEYSLLKPVLCQITRVFPEFRYIDDGYSLIYRATLLTEYGQNNVTVATADYDFGKLHDCVIDIANEPSSIALHIHVNVATINFITIINFIWFATPFALAFTYLLTRFLHWLFKDYEFMYLRVNVDMWDHHK